jgi:hypothetical protein
MKRNSKHGIKTNGTIRYVGNNIYSINNKFDFNGREIRTDTIKHCNFCGGCKFNCKGLYYSLNQYSKKNFQPRRENRK